MRKLFYLLFFLSSPSFAYPESFFLTSREAEQAAFDSYTKINVTCTTTAGPSNFTGYVKEGHSCNAWRYTLLSCSGKSGIPAFTYFYYCPDGYLGYEGVRIPDYWLYIYIAAIFIICAAILFRVRLK